MMEWNAAPDDWHTTASRVDLREGGTFSALMEAKDGSIGFDFTGTCTKLTENKLIECALGDRALLVEFLAGEAATTVSETFDAESTHSEEQQLQGWQGISENFAHYVENR